MFVCARSSRQVWGVGAVAGSCLFPVPPLPPRGACGGSSCPGVPYPRALVCHSMRSVRSAGLVRFPSGIPRVHFACVCARALAASAPFPPPVVGVARAPRVVWVQGAGGVFACGLCTSASRALVPCAVWLAFGGGATPDSTTSTTTITSSISTTTSTKARAASQPATG